MELKVTFMISMHSHSYRLGCSSLNNKDLNALSWQPKDPFNCLPWSNICQCTQRLIKNRPIWLTKCSYIPFGGTWELKWIYESSLFKELGCHASQTLKLLLFPYVPSRVYSRMVSSGHDYNNVCLDQVIEIQLARTF